jgi:hypothetical protein
VAETCSETAPVHSAWRGVSLAARQAIRYGDGWDPTGGGAKIEDQLPRFREIAVEAGRDSNAFQVTIGGAPDDLDRLKRLRDLGFARVVTPSPIEKSGKLVPILDRCAEYRRQLKG